MMYNIFTYPYLLKYINIKYMLSNITSLFPTHLKIFSTSLKK